MFLQTAVGNAVVRTAVYVLVSHTSHHHGTCSPPSSPARWRNGNSYVGDWSSGRAHGRGVFRYGSGARRSGERYEGQFVDGAKHGFGSYYYPDGRYFRGEYRVTHIQQFLYH